VRREPWYHKYSFLVFILIGLIGVSQAILMLVNPESGINLLAGFGYEIPDSLMNQPAGRDFTLFLVQWIGAVLFGGDFLTLCIAVTAWRRGERWAWFAFLYWPLLFITHFSLYRPGPHKYPPLMMLVLVVITMLANARRFLSPSQFAGQLNSNS